MNGMAAARRRAAGRRHVLRVQRLHAAGGAPRRALRAQGRLRRGPTTRSASARTARPTSRSSTSRRCGRCPASGCIRPADANETAAGVAGRHRRRRARPRSCSARQNVPVLEGTAGGDGVARGAYVLVDATTASPDLVLIGTGSEVSRVRRAPPSCSPPTASRPGSCRCRRGTCSPAQDDDYQAAVLPAGRADARGRGRRRRFGWDRWADDVVGIDRFGASAPGAVALDKLGYHRRATWPSAPAPARSTNSQEERPMTKLARPLRRPGPEPLARQPPARLDHRRRAGSAGSTRGVRGVTSNPTIFEKAIERRRPTTTSSSADLRRAAASIDDVYWALVIADIGDALAVLRPVYDASGGVDGFVSVEVAPDLAHDTDGTDRAGPRPARPHRRAEPLCEDPGDRRGLPRHPAR